MRERRLIGPLEIVQGHYQRRGAGRALEEVDGRLKEPELGDMWVGSWFRLGEAG